MVRAPGIYFEKADLAPRPVSVRTDVAGIVGFAPEGPVGVPVALDSYTQFETVFGAPREDLHLGWAVRGFFENGGIRAWVCRAAAPEASASAAVVADAGGSPAFRLEASSAGVWGDALEVVLSEATGVETLATGPVVEGRAVPVAATTAFVPGDLLRISQPGGFLALRVVNAVDHPEGRIAWAAGDPARARPTDLTLVGFDPAQPIVLTRLRYGLSVSRRGVFAAGYADLGIVPGGPRFIADVLAGLPEPLVAVDLRLPAAGPPAALALPSGAVALAGGRDGLATVGTGDLLRALRAFDGVEEPAIFLIPDLHEPAPLLEVRPIPPEPGNPCLDCPPPEPETARTPDPVPETPPGFPREAIARAQHALLDWCAARPNAFAVLDMPRGLATAPTESQQLLAWRRNFDSAYGALYHPWVRVPRASSTEPARATPAAGHVAGQMARMDLAAGVHHAAANRRILWAQEATLEVAPEAHGLLNAAGVNVIRATPGRGLRIAGARTLASEPAWTFVPVRRLVSMIGHALSLSSRWAIFEANDHATRGKLAAVYVAFLTAIWRRGGLAGADPSEAFFVRPGAAGDEAGTGRLTMTVGVAPLDPLEFIIFRIGREEGSVSVEGSASGRIRGAA